MDALQYWDPSTLAPPHLLQPEVSGVSEVLLYVTVFPMPIVNIGHGLQGRAAHLLSLIDRDLRGTLKASTLYTKYVHGVHDCVYTIADTMDVYT